MDPAREEPLFGLSDDDADVEAYAPTLVLVMPPKPPERYAATFVEPVRRLNETLNDVLDTGAHPERTPEEALSLLKDAMDTFSVESSDWFSGSE